MTNPQGLEQQRRYQWLEQLFEGATALPPYFHPTLFCIIDDNQSYLHGLSVELDDEWPHLAFTQPLEALAYLNARARTPLAQRCIQALPSAGGNARCELKLDQIEQEINDTRRFEQVSVVLIDYAMPRLDGLGLSRALELPFAQKAMLTGVAEEQTAIEAFNAGLIDYFIKKQSVSSTGSIIELLRQLQEAYFAQQSAALMTALGTEAPQFLNDPAMIELIRNRMRRQQLVEYYLVAEPSGLLMLDADGGLVRLLALNPAELEAQQTLAASYAAPADVQRALASGTVVLNLWDHPQEYPGGEPYPWRERLLPAARISGSTDWSVAWVEDPPTEIDFDPVRCSFNGFLSHRYPELHRD
ncbi:MAG: hypothetical protein AAGG11_20810 [Pseudomonadota bacterium]